MRLFPTRIESFPASLALAVWALGAIGSWGRALGADPDTTVDPSSDIARLLDIEPVPAAVVDPTGRYALFVHERQLLSLEQISEPAVDLAGHAISLVTGAAHAPLDYYGLTLVDLRTLGETAVVVPYDAVIGYPVGRPTDRVLRSPWAGGIGRSCGSANRPTAARAPSPVR